MEVPLDLTTIAALWMGGSILFISLVAFYARFAGVPLLEALARLRAAGDAPTRTDLQRRFDRMDEQLAQLTRTVEHLADEAACKASPLA